MVHISKQVIDDQVKRKLLDDLLSLVAGNDRSARAVWSELLSPDEKLQYAKRIALVLFLARGEPYRMISDVLGVSMRTIARHDRLRTEGFYRAIERRAGMKRVAREIGVVLLGLLDIATTPYVGERRRTLRKRYGL